MSNYSALKGRLARRLGSADAADEVLQETYLRVERTPGEGPVQRPLPYLFRIALNIAADLRRSDNRRLGRSEIELLLRLEQDELDPERVAEGRSSLRALVQALDDLPPRKRAIFMAARLDGASHAAIAARFGISTRLVERELKQALDHCRDRLEINRSQPFGTGRSASSKR
ncbi:RNA polymerase sigma factor [Aliidongia dinghuensis]|nr:sigma-70 family RNA polymerase sigma factor [Aliidongia dinghuensis]